MEHLVKLPSRWTLLLALTSVIFLISVSLFGQTKEEVSEQLEKSEQLTESIERVQEAAEEKVRAEADPVEKEPTRDAVEAIVKADSEPVPEDVKKQVEEERAFEEALEDMKKKSPEERATEEHHEEEKREKMKKKGAVETQDLSVAKEKTTFFSPPVTVQFRTSEANIEATFGIRVPAPNEEGYKPWEMAHKMRTLKLWQESTRTVDEYGREVVDKLRVFLTPEEVKSGDLRFIFYRLKKYEIEFEVIQIHRHFGESIENDFNEVTKSKWTHFKEQLRHGLAPKKSQVELAYLMTAAHGAMQLGAFVGIPVLYGTNVNIMATLLATAYAGLTTYLTTAYMQKIDRLVSKKYSSVDPNAKVNTFTELVRRVTIISAPTTIAYYGLAHMGYPTGAFYAILGTILAGSIPNNLYGVIRNQVTNAEKGLPSYIRTPEQVRFWTEKLGPFLNLGLWFGTSIFATLNMAQVEFFEALRLPEIPYRIIEKTSVIPSITFSSASTMMAGFVFLSSVAVLIPPIRKSIYHAGVKFDEVFTKHTDKIKNLVSKIRSDSGNPDRKTVFTRFKKLITPFREVAQRAAQITPELPGTGHIKTFAIRSSRRQIRYHQENGDLYRVMEMIEKYSGRIRTCHGALANPHAL